MSLKLNPYLNFDGHTREAMEFYKSVFGGKVEYHTFGEFPGMPIPDGYADKIMHSVLEADDVTLMASEGRPGAGVKVGDNVNLSLSGDDKDKLTGWFNALAEGGNTVLPLGEQVWGDTFGALVDKFGINWLVNITKA